MTQQEKIVVSAYTGFLMCDWSSLHKYIEERMGRPVWTHEMGSDKFLADLREIVKPDFLALCGPEGGANG